MEWTPYALPYLTAAAAGALAALLVWQHPLPAARTMRRLSVTSIVWSLGKAAELTVTSLDAKVLSVGIQYLAIVTLPVLWFVFAMQYSGRTHWSSRRRLALLTVIPVATLVMEATNTSHGLMRYDLALDSSGPLTVLTKTFGPWFYVYSLYSYGLMAVGALVLLSSLARSRRVYRVQSLALLVAVLLPLGADVAFLLGFSPVPELDLTPAFFALSFLIMAVGVLRYRMFDLVPAARGRVVDSISDAVLVLDEQLRVVDLNPAAAGLLRLPRRKALGRYATAAAASEPGLGPHLTAPQEGHSEAVLSSADVPRYFDVVSSALRERGRVSGWVMVLRDVSARKRAEKERDALIDELRETLVNVRTLSGLIPICASCKKIRDDQGFWQQVEVYVQNHTGALFTHALCPDCIAAKRHPDGPQQQAGIGVGGVERRSG